MHLDNYFTVNNKTRIYGRINQTAIIVLSTPHTLYSIDYYVYVKLLPCSHFNNKTNSCWCSADDDSYSYPAILKCDYVQVRAYIRGGYWVGYYPSYMQDDDHLYTVLYPSLSSNYAKMILLTNESGHSISVQPHFTSDLFRIPPNLVYMYYIVKY